MKTPNRASATFASGCELSRAIDPAPGLGTWVLICAVGILSYLVARLSGYLVVRSEVIWPLWLVSAFLVAALLSTRRSLWPMLLLAGFAGFIYHDVRAGLAVRSMVLFLVSDVGKILVAAVGIDYAFGGRLHLNTTRSVFKYLLIAGVLAPTVAAFFCAPVAGPASRGQYWLSWRLSFLAEALALLTLTPGILGWVDIACNWKRRQRAYYVEVVAMIAAIVAAGFVTFVSSAGSYHPELFYSLVLPFLLWAALRLEMTGINTVMLIVALLSTWGAVHGRGPFTRSDALDNVLSLQLFLLCAALPFMFLAALAEQHKTAHQSLRESETRFRLVANTAPVMIWMSDPDRNFVYFNQPWLDFTGRSIQAETGNGRAAGLHPEDAARCLRTYTQAFDRREQFRMEYRMRRHDGEYRWVLNHGVPRFTPEGVFAGFIGTAIDVTEAKVAQTKLAQATERLRLAMEAGGIGGWEVDLKTDRRFRFGTRIPALLALAPEIDSGPPEKFWAHVHPQDRRRLAQALEGAEQSHTEFDEEFRVLGEDGTLHWVRTRGKYVYSADGEPETILGISVETTERKRAEEVLASLSRRLIEGQEADRARIARDLHDDIGQRLALLSLGLAQVKRLEFTRKDEARRMIDRMEKQVFDITSNVNSVSHRLHSSSLRYLGLTAAARSCCKEFSSQHGVAVNFRGDPCRPLPPDLELCFFRVLQEALQNAIKHSGARHFEVELREDADFLELTVSDRGSGFDLESATNGPGLGLVSMRERLKLVNGELLIRSQVQGGTTVAARAPLAPPATRLVAVGSMVR